MVKTIKEINAAMFDKPRERPHAWIQWKGTRVCMDVHCACGHHGHVDAEFAYYVRCTACGRTYVVDGHIALHEYDPKEHPKDSVEPRDTE